MPSLPTLSTLLKSYLYQPVAVRCLPEADMMCTRFIYIVYILRAPCAPEWPGSVSRVETLLDYPLLGSVEHGLPCKVDLVGSDCITGVFWQLLVAERRHAHVESSDACKTDKRHAVSRTFVKVKQCPTFQPKMLCGMRTYAIALAQEITKGKILVRGYLGFRAVAHGSRRTTVTMELDSGLLTQQMQSLPP